MVEAFLVVPSSPEVLSLVVTSAEVPALVVTSAEVLALVYPSLAVPSLVQPSWDKPLIWGAQTCLAVVLCVLEDQSVLAAVLSILVAVLLPLAGL